MRWWVDDPVTTKVKREGIIETKPPKGKRWVKGKAWRGAGEFIKVVENKV